MSIGFSVCLDFSVMFLRVRLSNLFLFVSAGRGTSSMTVLMWRWLAVQRKRQLCGSLSARNPKRCSSLETFTTCAPTETATRSPPSPHTVRPIRKRSTRSLYERVLIIRQAASTFSCYCLLCCPCFFGYNYSTEIGLM